MGRAVIGAMSDAEVKYAAWWSQTCIGVAGDVGPFTCWTTHTGKVVFIRRAPPDKPPSERQRKQRMRFRAAMQYWQAMPLEEKMQWQKLVRRSKLCLSAHNLVIGLMMNPEPERLMRLNEKHGTDCPMPPWMPG